MPLTTEQFSAAMGLVDEIMYCDARYHGSIDGQWCGQLESAMADHAANIKSHLEAAEGSSSTGASGIR